MRLAFTFLARLGLAPLALGCLALVAAALPSRAQAQAGAAEELLWLKASWAPVFVEQGDGFGDGALEWLRQRLPEHRHADRFLPLPRLQLALAELPHACTASLARNPAREAQFLFSRDFLRMPGLAVVVRPGSLAALAPFGDAQQGIDLPRLVQDAGLDGVINENRSYGASLDPVLQAAPPERLKRLTRASTMVAMLAAERVDWVLLYPFEANWQARKLQPPPAIAALPIQGQKPVIASGIACARSDVGRRVIAKVDALIAAHPTRPWQAALNALLDAETRARMDAH